MYLYAEESSLFISEANAGLVGGKLSAAFTDYYHRSPSPSEVASWGNSLRVVAEVLRDAELNHVGVILEYELPLSSLRVDCLLVGRDANGDDQAVILELKQWSSCERSDADQVVTFVGGGVRDVLHPSVQASQYQSYLQNGQTAFHEGEQPIKLAACSFLHNYRLRKDDALLEEKFSATIASCPVFGSGDEGALREFLRNRLSGGMGREVLHRVQASKYRASKKLLDHVGQVVKGKSEYTLLDGQLTAYERVLQEARRGHSQSGKSVILIRGGPGTGKSVIAINLLAELSQLGLNTHYVTGSKAFTQTLKKIVGTQAAQQLKYFNSYAAAAKDAVDVMICDEAHRIRVTSNNQWTRAANRSSSPQIEELLHAGNVTVFFVDDRQVVRPGEIGSSSYILEAAEKLGCRIFDYSLAAQFRCAGSEGFINWVSNTLGIEATANISWGSKERFDFQIVGSPEELDEKIRKKIAEGHTARLVAGFCWPWSDPTDGGYLVDDVVVGDFKRPWNAKSSAGRLAPSIPRESLWAYDARGVGQVGCIYTAQGFEFDYAGVIFGKDLVYRSGEGWVGDKRESYDSVVKRSGDKFADLVKNTYRVLLTRGMKGCYVYFVDEETESFFKSLIQP